MAAHGVKTLIYSSTCATYGEPEKIPITEETPQVRDLNYHTFALFSQIAHKLVCICSISYFMHFGCPRSEYLPTISAIFYVESNCFTGMAA